MIHVDEVYNPGCRLCKLWANADSVCEPGFSIREDCSIMVVSRLPNSRTYQDMIEQELVSVGIDITEVFFTSAIKCRNWEQTIGKREQKACKYYLDAEIEHLKPKWILAFGNEALSATTGHSGIMKYRGKVIEKNGVNIVATLSPAAVNRNPGQLQSWRADLLFFSSQVAGRVGSLPLPKIHVIHTPERLVELKEKLLIADLISYDIETVGHDEFDKDAAIICLAGTLAFNDDTDWSFVLPLYHPQSPYKKDAVWRDVLAYIAKAFESVPKAIAHNGKFDARWLRQFGVRARVTFDTLLAAHLLDENRLKGLEPLCRILLGVANWKIDSKNLINQPLKIVLRYNMMDAWYTYHLYKVLRTQLIEEPRLLRLFTKLIMQANEELIDIERRGVWVDQEKLATATKIAFDMRAEIDNQLMKWVPQPPHPANEYCVLCKSGEHQVAEDWPKMGKRAKLAEVNFNASNFARWWLFEYLGMPVIERGKDKDDGSEGAPSMREAVIMQLVETGHEVPKLLLERVKWQKYCTSFVVPYRELLDENDRIHTNFKLAGTVTGRLSSGKTDEEKITTRRGKIRGVNLQQVPRDPFIRGLFGAELERTFVEADFSQAEMRIAGWLAKDPVIQGIYYRGEDVHLTMAMRMTGKPASQITKEERKAAKPVNFGYVFGMWWRKFIQTAWENYGIHFSEEEAKASRRIFFETYPGLEPWHNKQRRMVRKYGRIISPIGRIRHLPDIFSADRLVQQEAERQAINSPVQSFASDLNTLSMVLIAKQFREEDIKGYVLGVVHDACNFEIDNGDLARALPIIKHTMENLPLHKLFGVTMDMPMVADIKVGSHWGEAKEVDVTHVKNFDKYRHIYLEDR